MSDDDEKWVRDFHRRKRLAELQDEWGMEVSEVLDLCEIERDVRRDLLMRLALILRDLEYDAEQAYATGKTVWSFGHDPNEEHELVEVLRTFGLPSLDSGDPT